MPIWRPREADKGRSEDYNWILRRELSVGELKGVAHGDLSRDLRHPTPAEDGPRPDLDSHRHPDRADARRGRHIDLRRYVHHHPGSRGDTDLAAWSPEVRRRIGAE